MTALEKRLYDIANEIVGNVGPMKPFNENDAADNGVSVTGEEYVEFGMSFTDTENLILTWTKWIECYAYFVSFKFADPVHNEFTLQSERPLLSIYWRVLPEVSEEGGKMYARLLISLLSPLPSQ